MNAKYGMLMVVLGSLLCRPVLAQPEDPPDQLGAPRAGTISIQFPGGTLDDYVNALKDASPFFNIVTLVPESKDIRLPAIKLDTVAYQPAVLLVQGTYQLSDEKEVTLTVSNLMDSQRGRSVYTIRSNRHEIRRPPAQVRVWNIGGLIGPQRKAEDILTAVETAVGLLEGYEDAKIRYHAETNLIVASGEEEQLRAIDRVINGLHESRKSPDERRSAAQTKESLRDLIESISEGKAPPEAMKHFGDLQQDLQDKDRTIAELRKQLEAKKTE